jgi:hypothetical protein
MEAEHHKEEKNPCHTVKPKGNPVALVIPRRMMSTN